MKRMTAVLLLLLSVLLTVPSMAAKNASDTVFLSARKGKTTYSERLVRRLKTNSDMIVDGVISAITNVGKQDKCSVKLQSAYDLKMEYADVPLDYTILLPRKSVSVDQKVLLFLQKGKKQGSFTKAMKSNKSFVYRPEDYEFVLPLVRHNAVTRERIIATGDMKNYPNALAVANEYEKSFPGTIDGICFDAEKTQYLIVLTNSANVADVLKFMKSNTNNSPYYRIAPSDHPKPSELKALSDRIWAKLEQLSSTPFVASTSIDELNGKIVVEIVGLTDEKEELFKNLIGYSDWLSFVNADDYAMPMSG